LQIKTLLIRTNNILVGPHVFEMNSSVFPPVCSSLLFCHPSESSLFTASPPHHFAVLHCLFKTQQYPLFQFLGPHSIGLFEKGRDHTVIISLAAAEERIGPAR
jgi:hypothetical protein